MHVAQRPVTGDRWHRCQLGVLTPKSPLFMGDQAHLYEFPYHMARILSSGFSMVHEYDRRQVCVRTYMVTSVAVGSVIASRDAT